MSVMWVKVIIPIAEVAIFIILVGFPHQGYVAFTIQWLVFIVIGLQLRSLFPQFNEVPATTQDFVMFIWWFIMFVMGLVVASMWLFDGWHF